MKVVIIVQARMAASRLPGKVLRDLGGRTILEQLIIRMRRCRDASIMIATTTNPLDDAIVAAAKEMGVPHVRGSESDVLSRFVAALDASGADIAVRATADSPLLDPHTVDALVDLLIARQVDYVSTALEGSLPLGLGAEAFTAAALRRAHRETQSAWDREHVTPYLKRTDKGFKTAGLRSPGDGGHLRLTIDTPEDLVVVSRVFTAVTALNPEFGVEDLIALSRTQPHLFAAPTAGGGKSRVAVESAPVVAFRADADAAIGYGHLERCLRLAAQMKDARVVFLLHGDGAAAARIEAAGHLVRPLDHSSALVADGWFDSLPPGPTIAVLDLSYGLNDERCRRLVELCEGLGRRSIARVVLDGLGVDALVRDARFPVDLLVAPYCGVMTLVREGLIHLHGPSYAVLPAVTETPKSPRSQHRRVLLTFGGSDPRALTELSLEALERLADPAIDCTVIVGPGVAAPRRAALRAQATRLPGPSIVIDSPPNLDAVMSAADIAISTTGLTKYELAHAGVPALFIALNDDQATNHRAFDALGTGEYLGVAGAVSAEMIARHLADLIANAPRREAMQVRGRQAVDGRGALRIAQAITTLRAPIARASNV